MVFSVMTSICLYLKIPTGIWGLQMEPTFTNIIIGVGFRTYFRSVARYQETPTLSLFLQLDLWFNIFIE